MARRVPWVVLAAACVAMVAGQVVAVRTRSGVDWLWVSFLSFPIVGALVTSRQPRNAIGLIMLGLGGIMVFAGALETYAYVGLMAEPGSLPGPEYALAFDQHLWVPSIGLPATLLILLFPDGRPPTRRWRPWAYFCALALILCYGALTVFPGPVVVDGYEDVANPLGIDALVQFEGAVVYIVALIPIAMIGCAVGLIRRFRRSHGLVRLQLKWLAAAGALVATTYLSGMALNFAFGNPDPPWLRTVSTILLLAFALIPIAIGVAILRHRLYDIDVIINRTLVYGGLTAALTAAYYILVTSLQSLLRPYAGQSGLAVAGSTLAIAALFRPARVRIQGFVDRRFYRSKFDAEATVQSFSARLRDEVDLEALTRDLLGVVDQTMAPATSSLWLRATPQNGSASRQGAPEGA